MTTALFTHAGYRSEDTRREAAPGPARYDLSGPGEARLSVRTHG